MIVPLFASSRFFTVGLRTLLDQLAFFLEENNGASKLLLPVASFFGPRNGPRSGSWVLPERPLASCRRLNEVGVLPLANLEKSRRLGSQIRPKDDRSGESIYFCCRAENDVGGVVFLAARFSLLVSNGSARPADANTILTFFPYSSLLKSRRQKTHTGRVANILVRAFRQGN